MKNNLLIYSFIFILLLIFELLYFKIADKYNIVDKPNNRSSHRKITLRGGGIVFYFGILLYSIFYGFVYPYFLLGLSLICLISFADDIKSISSKIRLSFHFLALLLLFYQWGLLTEFPWWYIVIALFFCIGIINAYNFMDGINGITGGYSFLILLLLTYVNNFVICFVDQSLLYISLLAVSVFNIYNFRIKARCFSGDVGSIGMAFIILFILGRLILETENLSWIIFLIVYGVDSVLTIIRRLFLNENILLPHRRHVYQVLVNEMRIGHLKVTSMYIFMQGIIDFIFISIDEKYHYDFLFAVAMLLSLFYILFFQYLKKHGILKEYK